MVLIVGPNGVEHDVDGMVAHGLVRGGHARYAAQPAPAETPSSDQGNAQSQPAAESQLTGTAEPTTVPAAQPAPGETPDAPKGNASRDEFAAYAKRLGVEFPEDATRDQIRALVTKEKE